MTDAGGLSLVRVLGALLACASFATADDPQRRAQSAAQVIRTTHFFHDGRGLHAAALPDGATTLAAERNRWLLGFQRQTGFISDDDKLLGYFWNVTDDAVVGSVGCVACHAGRAAGRTYIGLGNKTIDVGQTGRLVHGGALLIRRLGLEAPARAVTDDAARLGADLSDERWANQTAGLVPTAMIFRWFYDQAGRPFPSDFPRGAVKVPALWGFAEKRRVGLFADGFADGSAPGWPAMVELAAGQTYAGYRSYRDRLQSFTSQFEHLLPPHYPFEIDQPAAERGARVFQKTCASCHGEYFRHVDGSPRFARPTFFELRDVGTDDDRLKYRATELSALIDAGPWRDDFRRHDRPPGYLAPRLEGIWARFPYLHNGSVPHLRALLTSPSERPTHWSLVDAGEAERFDPANLGLTVPAPNSPAEKTLQRRAAAGARDVYWVARPGQANAGHEFGTDLADDEKSALIEYLKTL